MRPVGTEVVIGGSIDEGGRGPLNRTRGGNTRNPDGDAREASDTIMVEMAGGPWEDRSSGPGEISAAGSLDPSPSVCASISNLLRKGPFHQTRQARIDWRPPRVVVHQPTPAPSESALIWDIDVTFLENGWSASGAFGVVNEGVWVDGQSKHHKVAIKSAARLWSESDAEYIKKELKIVAKVPHNPNIVRVIGGRMSPDPIIVEELMWGSLDEVLHKETKYSAGLTYGQIVSILSDVVAGLEHLHRHNVIHYDIKPGNILLEEVWDADAEALVLKAKLADFTCSKLKLKCSITASLRGTLGYIAPELIESRFRPATGASGGAQSGSRGGMRCRAERCDVYSLGVVMVECLVGTNGPGKEGIRVAQKLCPEPLWALAGDCTSCDPGRRPECCEIRRRLEDMAAQAGRWVGERPKERIWGACGN